MTGTVGSVHFSHFAVIYSNAVLACCFNSVLLYLIKTTVTKIGSYSKLLSVMAIFNMTYAVIHVFDAPFVLVDGHFVAFTPTGIFENTPSISYPLTIVYCSFFAQSLVLLMYHFLYRYIAVCRPHLMEHIHQPRVICLSILIYFIVAILWAFLVAVFLKDDLAKELIGNVMMEQLGMNVSQAGAITVAYMHPTAFGGRINSSAWAGALIGISNMVVSFSVMSLCAIRICRKLRDCQKISSNNYHQLQMQLFRALIVQTSVPFVLEYCACFLILFVPMSGFRLDVQFTTLCVSTYPALEPLVVIYFVRDYRTALAKKLRIRKPTVVKLPSVTPLDTSTWNYNSLHEFKTPVDTN